MMTVLLFLLLNVSAAGAADPCSCLPKGIARTDVVSAQRGLPERGAAKQVTVEQKLKELKARCRRGKLVDRSGKEIYFYHLKGCWGNPPENYQEILAQQAEELKTLRRRYHVVEMTCNASGEPIQ